MSFTSVPEERLQLDILQTLITFFSEDPKFAELEVTPNHPDKDTEFKIPSLVVKRVSNEDWALSRLSGFHGYFNTKSDRSIARREGYTFSGLYQFDLYTANITDQMRYSGLIYSKLKSPTGQKVFANNSPRIIYIPVYDFPDPTSSSKSQTDLQIRYKFDEDVDGTEVSSFAPGLHQFSISLRFWCHYLNDTELPRILNINHPVNLEVAA